MKVQSYMARQYAQPFGLFGRLVTAPLLNRANRQSNALVFEVLDVEKATAILEIGFGGAQLLKHIARAEIEAQIFGLELSDVMLDRAMRQLAADKLARPVTLARGVAEDIPFADKRFDRVCSVNTIYFWQDLNASLREIARVMKERGMLVLGFGSANSMRAAGYEEQGFNLYTVNEVLDALATGGFSLSVHRKIKREARGDFHVLKCIKISAANGDEHEI